MYPVVRAKNRSSVMLQKVYSEQDKAITGANAFYEVEYLQFPKLTDVKQIKHLFTTRIGGASRAHLGSMNLSYTRGDDPENVMENYRRIGKVLGYEPEHFVATDQTHTTNIRVVTTEDAGKGVVREKDYSDIDGLVTNVKGLVLSGFYADCVPLYFVDPVKWVIGLAHSGWRGTVSGMGAHMVETMQQVYGSKPEDIIAAIGPSICQTCYEISEEVMLEFKKGFWEQDHVKKICKEVREKDIFGQEQQDVGENIGKHEMILAGKEEGKYQLDLWLANYIVLLSAGIRPEHVDVTDICTCCNPEYLFSHRASKGLRGNLAAFLVLQEEICHFN